jgi:hypothetical protein
MCAHIQTLSRVQQNDVRTYTDVVLHATGCCARIHECCLACNRMLCANAQVLSRMQPDVVRKCTGVISHATGCCVRIHRCYLACNKMMCTNTQALPRTQPRGVCMHVGVITHASIFSHLHMFLVLLATEHTDKNGLKQSRRVKRVKNAFGFCPFLSVWSVAE